MPSLDDFNMDLVGLPEHKFVPRTLSDVHLVGGETDYERKIRFMYCLEATCMACSMCKLGRQEIDDNGMLRDPHVMSNFKISDIMFIQYDLCIEDVRLRLPLNDKYGKLFKNRLSCHKLNLDSFYVTTLIKCYAHCDVSNYAEICFNYLNMEINILKPKIIILVGKKLIETLGLNYNPGQIDKYKSISTYMLSDGYDDYDVHLIDKLIALLIKLGYV